MPEKKWAYVYRCRRCKAETRIIAGTCRKAIQGLRVAQEELRADADGTSPGPAARAFCICTECTNADGLRGFGWTELVGAEPSEER